MPSSNTKSTEAIGSVNKQINLLEKEIAFLINSKDYEAVKKSLGDTLLLWAVKERQERDDYIKEAFRPFKSKSTIGSVKDIHQSLYSLVINFENISLQYSLDSSVCKKIIIRDYNIDSRRQQIRMLQAKVKREGSINAKDNSNSKSIE